MKKKASRSRVSVTTRATDDKGKSSSCESGDIKLKREECTAEERSREQLKLRALEIPHVMDEILTGLPLADLKNLQLTSYAYYLKVIQHSDTWDQRVVRIHDRNVKEIFQLCPLRMWTAARVSLPIRKFQLESGKSILENLYHLKLSKSVYLHYTMSYAGLLRPPTKLDLSNNINLLFTNCRKLTSLYLDIHIMSHVHPEDFRLIRNLVENLSCLQITSHEYHFRPSSEQYLETNINFLSTLNWKCLSMLKIHPHRHFDTFSQVLNESVLSRLTTLDLSSLMDCVWSHLGLMPNLKAVSIDIVSSCQKYKDICLHFGEFLEKQPLLTFLNVFSKANFTFPNNLLEIIASRSSNLREFHFHVYELDSVSNDDFKFLQDIKCLQKLSLTATGRRLDKRTSMWNIMDQLENNKSMTHLSLSGFHHGLTLKCDEETQLSSTQRNVQEELSHRATNMFPRLTQCNFYDYFYVYYAPTNKSNLEECELISPTEFPVL